MYLATLSGPQDPVALPGGVRWPRGGENCRCGHSRPENRGVPAGPGQRLVPGGNGPPGLRRQRHCAPGLPGRRWQLARTDWHRAVQSGQMAERPVRRAGSLQGLQPPCRGRGGRLHRQQAGVCRQGAFRGDPRFGVGQGRVTVGWRGPAAGCNGNGRSTAQAGQEPADTGQPDHDHQRPAVPDQ